MRLLGLSWVSDGAWELELGSETGSRVYRAMSRLGAVVTSDRSARRLIDG
jgi:hypothetical protein